MPILVGTLGKAFGSFGAFVAGDAALIDYLMQRARTYIYTTALPPAVAAASRAGAAAGAAGRLAARAAACPDARFRAARRGPGLPLTRIARRPFSR